jgi:hypothetical protein
MPAHTLPRPPRTGQKTPGSLNQQLCGSSGLTCTLRSYPQDNREQPGARCGSADALLPRAPAGRGSAKAQGFLARVAAAAVRVLAEVILIPLLLIPRYPFVLLLLYYSNLLPYLVIMPQKWQFEEGVVRRDAGVLKRCKRACASGKHNQAARPTRAPSKTLPTATSRRVLGATSEPGSKICR